MVWSQSYTPLGGSLGWSALAAAIPIIFFFAALTVLKLKGHVAALGILILALLVAIIAYQMPASLALSSALHGFVYGLWPVAWIIITAVFLYRITVESGQFDIIRASIIGVTADQRIQLLLVGFSFGAFLEGAAGFGAPVAITAALLVGLGFKPLYAAGLCLIANTAPVAFGAMGIPITVAAQVSGLDPYDVGQLAGRQLPVMSIIVPFWLIAMMDGWRGLRQTWPAAFVCGITFAITQFLTANFIGHELPDITSALVSLFALTVFLRYWQPKERFTFEGMLPGLDTKAARVPSAFSFGQLSRAWMPFIILTAMVVLWTLPSVKTLLAMGTLTFELPISHMIAKTAPIVADASTYSVVYSWNILGAVGTAIFITALISLTIVGMKPATACRLFLQNLNNLKWPALSIGFVLAFAFVANDSGMSSTMALVLAGTGVAFPFFSPFLGWLGVFLTGSDTSSNALFGALQGNTAHQIGVSPELLVAANTTGGVTGKMISPQSISVACAPAGLVGQESSLFRFTLKHSLIFCTFVGIMTALQAYVMPWSIILFTR
ncbi:MAG: lactate permease LctP family transporter [Neisseriaceae bacterium]